MSEFLQFALPDIGEEEIRAVEETMRSGWLTTGVRAHRLEASFGQYSRARHALAVSSGTAALHLALAALGIAPGDEVITTPLTFCATVNVILETGATPVLADIGPDLNLDPAAVRRALTPRTRAILPVHLGGLPCDMDAIWEIARERGLLVVEDAAHAVDARYREQPMSAGASDAVAYSFYATKSLCAGEGGMATTNSAELAARMRVLRLHGISRDAWDRYAERGSWYYDVVEQGFKYNLPDILAAIAEVQLARLDSMLARRRQIAEAYNRAFGAVEELELPPVRAGRDHSWHLYPLRLNLSGITIGRAQFIEELKSRGIGASVHFIPILLHPCYRRRLAPGDPCERAIGEFPRLVSLPIYSRMRESDAERVIAAVVDIVTRFRRRCLPTRPAAEVAVAASERGAGGQARV